jgi:hypothetical protein
VVVFRGWAAAELRCSATSGRRMAYRTPRLALSIRVKIGNDAPLVGALS